MKMTSIFDQEMHVEIIEYTLQYFKSKGCVYTIFDFSALPNSDENIDVAGTNNAALNTLVVKCERTSSRHCLNLVGLNNSETS